MFYEVVVPLLELDRTALICISTILDSFSTFRINNYDPSSCTATAATNAAGNAGSANTFGRPDASLE